MIKATLLALTIATPALADIYTLHDGDGTTPKGRMDTQAGVTCGHYNAAALITWRNKGGDWTDAKGTAQGTSPFATVPYVAGLDRDQIVELNVLSLVKAEGIILRRNAVNTVKIATRESTTPPVLILTLADGSKVERQPTADGSMPFVSPGLCQTVPTGKGLTMTLGNAAVLSFGTLPSNVVKAQLRLTIKTAFSSGVLEAYALSVPRSTVAVNTKVDANPNVYYHEGWEDHNWWQRTGGSLRPDAQWTQDGGMFKKPDQNGLWSADGSTQLVLAQGTTSTLVPRGAGHKGKGLMIVYHPDILAYGVDLGNVILRNLPNQSGIGTDPNEAWLTYWIKYGKDFHTFANCEGGKAPGLSGITSICAGSAIPANGYCGWSLRNAYRLICDPTNPAFGNVVLHTYAYHGLQTGTSGQGWFGSDLAVLQLEKWHCIEQRVKVNTPGFADGINQVYVNGKLAIDRQDVYLRAEKPSPEGYGDWRQVTALSPAPLGKRLITDKFGRTFWFAGTTIASDLGIQKAYMVVHNGGMAPPRKTAQMWLDEVKVSDRRVGCD